MPDPVTVKVQRLPHYPPDWGLPEYETSGAAAVDLRACIGVPITIPPGGRAMVKTGLAVAIPPGYQIEIRPRSGNAHKHALTVTNAPGTIDADYRGEIAILLINHNDVAFSVMRGDRIAQAVLMPAPRIQWALCGELPPTERGAGGFGSTGT